MARRGGAGFFEKRAFAGARGTSAKGSVWIDDAQVVAALRRIARKVDDLKPLWTIMDTKLQEAEGEYFSSRGEGSWAGLTPAYAVWKAKHGGGELMVLSGALRQSLASSGGAHLANKTKAYMRFGTRQGYGDDKGAPPTARKGKGRKPLDAKSAAIQKGIGEALKEYAKQIGMEWGK